MLPRHPSHPRHPRHPRPVQGIWILLACIVVFIGALAIYHFYLMAVWGVLQWYLIAFFGLLGLIAGISYSIRRTHYFHLHHYFIFGYTTATPPCRCSCRDRVAGDWSCRHCRAAIAAHTCTLLNITFIPQHQHTQHTDNAPRFLLLFTGFQNPLVAICQNLLAGIYVEGAYSAWCCARVFVV